MLGMEAEMLKGHLDAIVLAALEAANPGVTPTKLRVGQPLNLPQ